jgi:hypothetical protein
MRWEWIEEDPIQVPPFKFEFSPEATRQKLKIAHFEGSPELSAKFHPGNKFRPGHLKLLVFSRSGRTFYWRWISIHVPVTTFMAAIAKRHGSTARAAVMSTISGRSTGSAAAPERRL